MAPPPVGPWESHEREIGFRVASLEVDFVQVVVGGTRDKRQQLLDLRVEYVGATTNSVAWVSLLARHPGLLMQLRQFKPAWSGVLRCPWVLPLQAEAAQLPCLLVWRHPGLPIDVGRLSVQIIRVGLGVDDPDRIRVRYNEVDQQTTNRRSASATRLGERQARHTAVLASCEKCGRDLRDPAYAAVGIGPECIKSYPAEQVRVRRELNRALRSGETIRLNAKPPEAWLSQVTAHWTLE